jgi:uncharacterized protein YggE
LLVLAVSASAFAQATPKRITVTGTASIPMMVDYVSVNYTIRVVDADFGKAQDGATAASVKTMAMLKSRFAVSEKDMKTLSYWVAENMVASPEGAKPEGFAAEYRALVKFRKLEDLTLMLRALRDTGVSSIGGIEFGVDDSSKYEAEAIKKAFANAEDKAKAAALAAKRKLKGAVTIVVLDAGGFGGFMAPMSAMGFAAGLGDSGAIMTSDQMFRCSVSVEFEME